MMRLAMAAFLLLAAMAAPTEAQSLPKPKSRIAREWALNQTHSARPSEAKLPAPVRDSNRGGDRGIRQSHGVRGK